MANTLFFLLSLSLAPLILSHSLQNHPSHPTPLIQSTCNATAYYEFCIASLASDPAGSTASDVRSLSVVAINIAMTNATNTSSIASTLAQKATDPSLRALLRTCATKYVAAQDALHSATQSIKEEMYDYAFIHVSAAAEYPSVCRVLFKQAPRLTYPPELERREEGLEMLCKIALDMISLLG
ncbi:cell wall / vacuolar inhibitor of fructosidase 2 [Carex rostrata]